MRRSRTDQSRRATWCLLFLATVAASCAPQGNTVETALAVVSRDAIQASIDYLAADERQGRLTGTAGYDDAAQFVAQQFAAMGLEPGGTDGWMQPVPMIRRTLDASASGVTLHTMSGQEDLRWIEDAIVYADPERAENRIQAEVVYVGFGVHAPELGYSDYDSVDVTGRIVAMFGGAPSSFPSTERAHYSSSRTKAEELARRGAVGLIRLSSSTNLEGSIEPFELSWVGVDGQIADFLPEIEGHARLSQSGSQRLFAQAPVTFGQASQAADNAEVASLPLNIEATLYRRSEHERLTSPNVVGILPGTDPELGDEHVVYSSHLDALGTGEPVDGDAIYNGMWDNALGVAMMLETARALAALPDGPRRSLVFVAVTGEEWSLLGSDYFAQNPTVPAEGIVASVNLDMPLVFFPLNTVTGYGAEHSSLEELMTTEAGYEGFTYTPDPYPEEVYFIRSDQYSFVRQGIPSLYLAESIGSSDPNIDGREVIDAFTAEHYHKPSDDLTSTPIHWDTALRFVRASVRIGYRIATDDARPTWNEGDFFGDRFGR